MLDVVEGPSGFEVELEVDETKTVGGASDRRRLVVALTVPLTPGHTSFSCATKPLLGHEITKTRPIERPSVLTIQKGNLRVVHYFELVTHVRSKEELELHERIFDTVPRFESGNRVLGLLPPPLRL